MADKRASSFYELKVSLVLTKIAFAFGTSDSVMTVDKLDIVRLIRVCIVIFSVTVCFLLSGESRF